MIKTKKKSSLKLKIDWRSKFVDLIIVIVGISIAFQLNSWNESRKTALESDHYVQSFFEENTLNENKLSSALAFTDSNKAHLETLQTLLLSKSYEDPRLNYLIGSLMGLASFSPSTTTMENITASGEFELLKDVELRRQIINVYNSYKTVEQLEGILVDYVNNYLTPYLFNRVRFSDFSAIGENFITDPKFENIVIGYGVLLNQLHAGYQSNLEKVRALYSSLDEAQKSLPK